ncbi:GNAT family N-acetyltransferase [Methylophaga sp. OBS3]|uniref:GNAT family N-acetyltransferase n=1 Tax=Methylophaga sp. OBS3 TaxID=2991934 RepID=UPI0022579F07|nr:GNAT family N-acetyltransferase [Methylophaga sp. OBS3]MCX4190693.1 GNAT family N-acetyltransferase [Methylophaga sp. OBS3]
MAAAQRLTVFCQGDAEVARQNIEAYLAARPNLTVLWLAEQRDPDKQIISQSQANQFLGQEVDLLVFDASHQCRPDSLGAALGTLRGGGIFFLLLPDTTESFWLQRFIKFAISFTANTSQAMFWRSGDNWPHLPEVTPKKTPFSLTQDQRAALAAIDKVMHGHRRRPLLITADRGRGKSAVLGIAAANFIKRGKTQILVTAPSKAAVVTLYQHASKQLGCESNDPTLLASIRFMAPEQLLHKLPETDLLLVDEAAALPQAVLHKLVKHYARVVFASTLHGYEGSGSGFKLQFAKLLDEAAPGWQEMKLTMPVRWAVDDALEQFSYQALLLNTTQENPTETENGTIVFNTVSPKQLLADEKLLQQLFALLVNAHYRTRPSDLQAILDDDNRTTYLLFKGAVLIGAGWINQEGPLAENLALAVHQGQRRLPSQLLPQSLLTQAGDLQAGSLNYQRIIRIAIQAEYQQQGYGTQLLNGIEAELPTNTDILGCSFAFQEAVYAFWFKNAFKPVRLGLHEDTVSAGRAVVMLKPKSASGERLIGLLQTRLAEQWPTLLPRYYADLPASQVKLISESLPLSSLNLSAMDKADIAGFIHGQRALEFSFVPMLKWLWDMVSEAKLTNITVEQQALLIEVFLQQKPITVVCQQHQLSGQKALLKALRDCLSSLWSD